MPTPSAKRPSRRCGMRRVLAPALVAAMLATHGVAASGRQNPIMAGMEAMLDAMGYEQKSRSPFPDDDPIARMPWSGASTGMPWSSAGSMPGMSPWSSFGGMPGMSPWSSFGGMPGMSPWSSFGGLPGMSPFGGGMPGTGSPWDYARPQGWERLMGNDMPRLLRPGDPDSATRALDGLWVGKDGERLWFRDGWLRVYRDVASDARALLHGRYLFVGIPETRQVLQYEYGVRGDYLGLRDADGNVQMFRRYR